MKRSSLFPVLFLSLALPALAGTDCWTYVPPASGTQGTISWTDSSGFENVVKGAVLSGGQITFAHSKNTSSTTLRNLDLSLPVYAEDGVTQYEFSPYALGRSDLGGRIVSGSGVTNIVLYPGCKSVGRYCFKGCTELVKVTLNDGLEDICEDAFREDKVLAEIVNFFPDSLKTIGVAAFRDCTVLAGAPVANGLVSMGNRAFHTDKALQGFDCGNSTLSAIDEYTFYNCSALQSVVLPDTLTIIGNGAFEGCSPLSSVSPLLPPKLATLGSDSNPSFINCPIEGHMVSPSTLARIGTRAFRNSKVETFTGPKKGLKSIGQYVFWGNTSITNVVLSSDLESLTAQWFGGTGVAGVEQHVWFRNLPATIPSELWGDTKSKNITIHLPLSKEKEWREWVASGPSGHTFTFDNKTATLPEHPNDVGTWLSSYTQYVTWWKDEDAPTMVLIK